jgi:hypothetical protein
VVEWDRIGFVPKFHLVLPRATVASVPTSSGHPSLKKGGETLKNRTNQPCP